MNFGCEQLGCGWAQPYDQNEEQNALVQLRIKREFSVGRLAKL
jgi:hypothetical protein